MNKNHSKNYQKTKQKLNQEKYTLDEAIDFLIKEPKSKTDPTLDLHLYLNLRKGKEQTNIRFLANPPYALSKPLKIALVSDKKIKEKNILNDSEKILKDLKKGIANFDILIATPKTINKLMPFAKFLGPKGLMPTEKSGTLTDKPGDKIKALMSGQKEFKNDAQNNLHLSCGKLSLGKEKLTENINYLLLEVKKNKPSGIKGNFILKAKISTTQSPSLNLEL